MTQPLNQSDAHDSADTALVPMQFDGKDLRDSAIPVPIIDTLSGKVRYRTRLDLRDLFEGEMPDDAVLMISNFKEAFEGA